MIALFRCLITPGDRVTARHVLRSIWSASAAAWLPLSSLPSYAAIAAAGSALNEPFDLPPVLMFVALAISTLAGATALSIRIDRELSIAPDRPLPRPWSLSISHMLGAWCAGVGAFLFARQTSLEVWSTLGLVLVGSFANAAFVEWLLEKWMPWRKPSPSGSTEPQP